MRVLTKMASQALQQLVDWTRPLAEAVLQVTRSEAAVEPWSRLRRRFAGRTGNRAEAAFAEAVAQAVACGHYVVATDTQGLLTPAARAWLMAQADPLLGTVWHLCLGTHRRSGDDPITSAARGIARHLQRGSPAGCGGRAADTRPSTYESVIDFCERFPGHYDTASRRRHGIYYTPPTVARFVVRRIDEHLRDEFALSQGLADGSTWRDVWLGTGQSFQLDQACSAAPFVRLLDPAMGSGVFLIEAFEHIHQWWRRCHGSDRVAGCTASDAWDRFVNTTILPRIWGQDLLLPAVAAAQLLLTLRLAASGYTFREPAKLELHLGNSLRRPRVGNAWLHRQVCPFTVVVGNPPFAGVSDHHERWLHQLLRGRAPGHRAVASYLHVDGQPLGERKHWLEDDYVKFLRLAHWLIEFAGTGLIGFVTNHGFLDNTTFRGLRAALLRTFPRLSVIDLHGSTRAGGPSPQGTPDASVFGIEQGTAISLLRRPPSWSLPPGIEHAELWGTRPEKLAALEAPERVVPAPLEPCAPHYFLVPHDRRSEAEYARGYRLPEIMPVHSTAAVTARDAFVIAFSAAELEERIAILCDEHVSDAEIRQRFFPSHRSPRYLPGDTRGWRLAATRDRLRREPDWPHYVRDCLYRPFDRRKIFWAPWIIDWPREAVMRHLLDGRNLALVTRRQSPAAQAWNFLWVTDTIAVDGLIRSDNRGSESVFPLHLYPAAAAFSCPPCSGTREVAPESACCPNFSEGFIQRMAGAMNLPWDPASRRPHEAAFNAPELFHYVYALLHATSYRDRFATWLRVDFPRVFVPRQARLFRRLARLGARLVRHHLLRADPGPCVTAAGPGAAACVGPGYPRYQSDRIALNPHVSVGPVTRDVWEYRVGTHQVCRKWLKDRRGRRLLPAELQCYCQLVTSLGHTQHCLREIDDEIDRHGGWPKAFT